MFVDSRTEKKNKILKSLEETKSLTFIYFDCDSLRFEGKKNKPEKKNQKFISRGAICV